ncbi:MAG TPA: UMP kinase [Thermoplasmata archaeon]|nr:UMP kinase [Thermoplasmata archaeon]
MVLSLGGSLFLTGESDVEYLARLSTLLKRFGASTPLLVTVGGGATARQYIDLGRALGLTEVELDELGIDVTRLHARLLAGRIGPPTPAHPPASVAAAVHELARASPVVMGGTEPGHTTDGVGALLAVRLRAARFVNATRVGALYDRDPAVHPGAERRARLSWDEFRAIVHRDASGKAGQQFLFDRLGADLLHRAGIPLAVVDGRDLRKLEAALAGRRFTGTLVT